MELMTQLFNSGFDTMIITIQHQSEKTYHTFSVVNPNNLTGIEVWGICLEMNVTGILVNGKYYGTK